MRAICFVWLVLLWAAPTGAQWLDHPTPGLPRKADGKPNRAAPTPRTANGKVQRKRLAQAGC